MTEATKGSSLSKARSVVNDLFATKPHIYWLDFGCSISMAYVLALSAIFMPVWYGQNDVLGTAFNFLAVIGAALLFYRSLLFIHELAHFKRGTMKGFRIAWNVLCGVPMLSPSFTYHTHLDHHRRQHYGTKQDGEYLPLVHAPRIWIIYSLVVGPFSPFMQVLRFFIASPLCWLSSSLRSFIHARVSSVVTDPTYLRPEADANERRTILIQEAACFVWCIAVTTLLCTVLNDWALRCLVYGYVIWTLVLTLNAFRSTGSHRWVNVEDAMTFSEQVGDSLTYPSAPWLTELWGPVGTRFHAMHHMFPSMPYHALPEAHRRVMKALPPDSFYHQTVRASLLQELAALWVKAGKVSPKYHVLEFVRSRMMQQTSEVPVAALTSTTSHDRADGTSDSSAAASRNRAA